VSALPLVHASQQDFIPTLELTVKFNSVHGVAAFVAGRRLVWFFAHDLRII